MFKKLVFFVIAFQLALAFACSDLSKRQETQNKPESADGHAQVRGTDAVIEFYQARIKRDPDSYFNYTKLGEAYIQKARETGDLAYYDKAEEVLKKSLELYPDSHATLLYLGQVSSSRHEFQETLNYAIKAVELKPREGSPYGVLGDAYLELGEYDKARQAYEKMLSISPGLYSYSRISHIKDLTGDTEGAVRAMEKAIEEGVRENLPRENIAWAKVILGSLYFNKGDLKEAQRYYNEALEILDNYYLALEHLAEINAVQGSYEEAADLYKKVLEINPNPQFYVALADVYANLGKQGEAEKLYSKALEQYEGYLKAGNNGYLRELVLFYADHEMNLEEALGLAKKDMEIRKDIYAYDTLGWVYYKQGNFEKALNAAQKSLRFGTKDSKLFYHIGMIYYKLEEFDEAKKYLHLALSTNPYFDINSAKEAKNVLEKIDKKEAQVRS